MSRGLGDVYKRQVLLQEELEHLLLQLLTMRVLQHISKLRKVQMAVQLTVQLMTTSH